MNDRLKNIKFKIDPKRIIIFVLLIVLAIFYTPKHIKRILLHQLPGTNDQSIFNNTIVETGTPQPWEKLPADKTVPFRQKELKYLNNKETYSFVVVHKGKIVNEYYGEESHPRFRTNTFSLTHGLISLLTGCALKDGSIKSLNQKVTDFYPVFSSENENYFTIKSLLTMTSGFNPPILKNELLSVPLKAYYSHDIEKKILSKNLKNTPGEVWAYNGADTQLLSMILNRATGRSVSKYFEERIWKPIGAETPALWSTDDKGNEKAFCCFFATARDFARIGQLVLNKGVWNGTRLIDRQYINLITAPQKGLKDKNGNAIEYYGMHWWLTNYKNRQVVYLQGYKGQYLIIVPQDKIVIVRFGEKGKRNFNVTNPEELFKLLDIGYRVSGIDN